MKISARCARQKKKKKGKKKEGEKKLILIYYGRNRWGGESRRRREKFWEHFFGIFDTFSWFISYTFLKKKNTGLNRVTRLFRGRKMLNKIFENLKTRLQKRYLA